MTLNTARDEVAAPAPSDAQPHKRIALGSDYGSYEDAAKQWVALRVRDRDSGEEKQLAALAENIRARELQIDFSPAELDLIWQMANSKKACSANSHGKNILRPE